MSPGELAPPDMDAVNEEDFAFYLGTHELSWLPRLEMSRAHVRLFVSYGPCGRTTRVSPTTRARPRPSRPIALPTNRATRPRSLSARNTLLR
jgi:hypothetical protein